MLSLVACSAKKPWTKDAIVNECLGEFNKRNETEKRYTGMQIPYICDCMGDKLSVKYKSDDEASNDKAGVQQISLECATKVMSK